MDQSDLLTRSGNTEDEEREVILELTRRTKSLRKGKPKEEVDKKSLKDEKEYRAGKKDKFYQFFEILQSTMMSTTDTTMG